MKKIIVMTGSFNPVTKAHYEIMSDAVRKYEADEGLFILTSDGYLRKKNLLKVEVPSSFVLTEEQRAEMINSLKAENPKISCYGVELGGVDSKTFKTLESVMKKKQREYGEEIKLYFLFGADKLKQVPRWRNAEEMVDLCEYLVYTRKIDLNNVISSDPFLTKNQQKIHIMEVDNEDLNDVSSTEVRRRFFAGEDFSDLMNDGAYNIMKMLSPKDFPEVTKEDIIKGNILYGGHFGKNAARTEVYKTNRDLFNSAEFWEKTGDRGEHQKAVVYKNAFTVTVPVQAEPTETACYNEDCTVVAKNLIDEGFKPAILNLASRITPCGGYHKGSSAQEESLCYMSTLSQSLYQFENPKYKRIQEAGVSYVPGVYPMDYNYGGIYSPRVTFFRNNEKEYYSLKSETFDCPVVTVASLSNREENEFTNDERRYFDENGYLNEEGKIIETNKIRTIYRIALENGCDSMVLGAFGCGVYNLKPDEISKLFSDVLHEEEFLNRFRKIVFAIYEGKPSARNPLKGKDGKFADFYRIFV